MTSVAIGHKNIQKNQFIDMWKMIIYWYCRWDKIQSRRQNWLLTSVGTGHKNTLYIKKIQFSDTWEIIMYRYCRWDKSQFHSTSKFSYCSLAPGWELCVSSLAPKSPLPAITLGFRAWAWTFIYLCFHYHYYYLYIIFVRVK